MWLKFKNVATFVIETFHLLLLTLILGHTFHVKQIDDLFVMASTITTIRTTTPLATAHPASSSTSLHGSHHHRHPAVGAATTTFSQSPVTSLATATTSRLALNAAGSGAATSLLSLSTLPLPSQSSSTAYTSLWETATTLTTNASKLLNLTPNTADAITDSNEIDTMDISEDVEDENENEHEGDHDRGFLDMDYVMMAKHIALSDESTSRGGVVGAAAGVEETIRNRIWSETSAATVEIALPEATFPSSASSSLISTKHTSSPSVTLVTPSMSTATIRHRNNPAAMTTTITTATAAAAAVSASSTSAVAASALLSSASLVNQRFNANKTRLDDLSSLSLLSSLNDTSSADPQLATSSMSLLSLMADAASTPTLSQTTRSMHPATVVRIRNDEQNMHNTNSHLTVDNVNATIVASGGGEGGGGSASSHHHSHYHHHHQAVNTSASATTSNSRNNSSTNLDLADNGFMMSASGNIGGEGPKLNGTGTTRISARKVEHKHLLPKSHKTDAPMLNYIFDTFSSANKHHHHDQRYGPHFEDVQLVGKPTNMTVQAGSSIHLNCRISLLQDKTVSWVRRNPGGENALDLLTVGLHTYTGDKRYKMEFQYPNNWRLKIVNVKKDDEATYECQISTHPPRVIQINLHVNAPKVMIVDEFGDPLQEKYYEQDSTLQLSCVVRNVAMSTSVVFWKHSEDVLNYDVTRGGISVKTELMDDGANSTLSIAKINKADSGNYTCSISEYQNYTIIVHILNGESFAELHHGSAICWRCPNHQAWPINFIVIATILLS
uniref:Ig-like domain-containing protein n=1 Tax=Stomoxys calcitrans TaxID=35570 RepID=A0A1I8NQ85_STOCA